MLKMTRPISLLLIGSLLLALTGCWGINAKSVGAGPWDKLPLDEIEFTPAEEAQLKAWKDSNKDLFKKLQNHSLALRAVIETHNKLAMEHNKKLREQLGYTDSDLDALKEQNLK
jgi:hypothetical protein